MGIILLPSHSGLRFCTLYSFKKQLHPPKFVFSIRDAPSTLVRKHHQLVVSCKGSDEDRKDPTPQRSSSQLRARKKGESKESPPGEKSKSSNQEEIITLFRRIQSSISEEEPFNVKKTNFNALEKKPSAQSIQKVLQASRKQGKTNKGEDKELRRRRRVLKKGQGLPGSLPVTDLKLTRPPSKFVKRSPIPTLSAPRVGFLGSDNAEFSTNAGAEEPKLPRLDKLKLTELKELAKSRGIKGYSKLKKSELVALLSS